jgi:hypothetical protein
LLFFATTAITADGPLAHHSSKATTWYSIEMEFFPFNYGIPVDIENKTSHFENYTLTGAPNYII